MSSQDGIVTLGLDVPQLNVPRSMGIKTKKSRFKKKKSKQDIHVKEQK